MGHTGVGGSCRGGVGHTGVGWLCHGGVGCAMEGVRVLPVFSKQLKCFLQ